MFLAVAGLIPSVAGASELLMPQFGYQTVQVTETIDFYDMKGTADISSSSSNNSWSTVIFTPAEEGEVVQISFESVEVLNDGSNWPASLQIYNGVFDTSSVEYPTTTSNVGSGDFPETDQQLARLDGTYSNLVYTSTSADGALSVCFHYRYAKACAGWVAKVRSVKLVDMTLTGVEADYSAVPASVYPGQKDIELGSLIIKAEGITNPYSISSLSFSLQNEGGIDVSSLSLWSGTSAVDAVLSNVGDVYTYSIGSELAGGANKFTVKANVADTAPFYGKISLQFTDVVTSAASTPAIAPGTPVISEVAAMVLMPSEATMFTVDDKGFLFYDDGGPDGKISEQFKGQVTFVPAVAGQKVMVDFSKLELFNTNPARNDIFKFYNGKEVDESRLLKTLLTETSAVVRSTSEDGALTITLTSTTGVPKDGWEATVKLFVPQAMTLSNVTTKAASTATVVAGSQDAEVLTFNIVTENTEPALELSQVVVNTLGTNEIISKAKVYYTKDASAFAGGTPVGEAQVTSDDAVITFSSPVALAEGDNYFHIAYDVAETAQNDMTIGAKLMKLKISNADTDIDDTCESATRVIRNVVYAVAGTTTKYVYGSLEFDNEPATNYSSGYTGDYADRIVVFYPGNSGKVIEMEFSKFNFYFPTYGTAPTFKIYNGNSVAGAPVYELTKSNKNEKPSVRSTSADGALTVVFNAGGNSATSSTYGWTALVSEYQLQPMVIGEVAATQTNSDIIKCSPVQTNQELIGFNVITTGGLDPFKITGVTVDLKGCAKDIAKVYLTASGNNNSLSINNVIASAVPSESSETVTLTPSSDYQLVEGINYFWINVDMNEGVSADQIIDAMIVNVAIGGNEIVPVNNDPEGYRITKNIYLMESGTGHVVPVGSESIMFYDDGGAEDPITKYFSGTVTFVPKDEDKVIKLVINNVSLSTYEKFNVYFSSNAGSTPDVVIDNTSVAPIEIVSLGEDGSLTVDFSSNAYSSGAGWEIEVMEYVPVPLSLGSISVEAVNDAEVLRGEDALLLKVALTIDGDKGSYVVDNLSFDVTDGAVFSSATLYATGKDAAFTTSDPVAVSDGDFSFDCDYEITLPGTYYFFLTASVRSDATLLSTADVKAASLSHGGEIESIESEVTASLKVVSGFSGVYTIGSSGEADYATFSDAVDAMAIGVEGAVVFEVEDGVYDELVSIAGIKGVSPVNTITFRSKSGNPEDVVLCSDSYSQPEYSDDREHYEYGVLTVREVDYLTIEGITVKTSVTTFPSVIRLVDGAEHFTLDNCVVESPISTNSYSNGKTDLLTTYVQSGHNEQLNNYITARNTTFRGGYIGVNIGGKWATVNPEQGSRIENCRFENNGSKAVYVSKGNDVVVSGCTVNNNATTVSTFYIFDLDCSGAYQIVGNRVNYSAETTTYCFYMRNSSTDGDVPSLIANNECILNCGGKQVYWMYINKELSNINIAHNSVLVKGNYSNDAVIFFYKKTSGNVVNNIFQNEAGGYVFRYNTTGDEPNIADVVFANNSTYSSGTYHTYAYSSGIDYAAWTEASGETGGINGQVAFESGTSLYPAEAGNLVNGVPLDYVATDIEGKTRSTSRPTIGAYEYVVEDAPDKYVDGVFVVNEDWFGHNNSTVNYISNNGEWTYRAFQLENPGLSLGCTNQFGTIYGDRFYFISKQDQDGGETRFHGARITVADAGSLTALGQIQVIGGDSGADGRSFLGVDETKGYVSTTKGIWIMDLTNNTVTDKVTMSYAEDEVGTMIRVNDKVFAATKSHGITVIDPETDNETAIIDMETVTGISGAGVGSVVLSKDGKVWASVSTNGDGGAARVLVKIDPKTMECSVIDVPDGLYGPANSWYAWTPDGFCASTQENVLFWNGGKSSWFSSQTIFRYDIDKGTISEFLSLEDDVYLYGCSMRVHPVTDEIYMSVNKGNQYGNDTYLRRYDTDGTILNEYGMESNYWFPSIPVFPDVCEPVAKVYDAEITINPGSNVISLLDIATDADNMAAAMVKTVYENMDPDVVEAEIVNGDLVVTLDPSSAAATATVKVKVNSNGKTVIVPIPLQLDTSGVECIDPDLQASVKYADGVLYVNGCGDGRAMIYSMAGCLVADIDVTSSQFSAPLGLPTGVYVVSVNGKTVKIAVR